MFKVILALKNSLVSLIKQQTDLMNLVRGVFLRVPPNTKFPYIYLGSNKLDFITTKTSKAIRLELIVAIFDQNPDNKPIYLIASSLEKLLNNNNLEPDGIRIINFFYKIEDLKLDKNGITQQINIYLNYMLEGIWECSQEV